ncbi:unnamed protein product, partial [marine sediment metagenome]
TERGRPYSEIIEILVEAANDPDKEPPQSGGGADWFQVAAADIYNSANNDTRQVFSCVWKVAVSSELGRDAPGGVNTGIPWRILLNPYVRYPESSKIRFNKPGLSGYRFSSNKFRDYVIHHEAIHSYENLPGTNVYDEENNILGKGDGFIVGREGINPYCSFIYDHKVRGVIDFNRDVFSERPYSCIRGWLHGLHGDSYFNTSCFIFRDGTFITRIDDLMTQEEIMAVFFAGENAGEKPIPTDIPDDMPFLTEYNDVDGIWL